MGRTVDQIFKMSSLNTLAQMSADLVALTERSLPKVFTVYPLHRGEKFAHGSGWGYGPDLVVTNNHVADGMFSELLIRSRVYGELRAELVGTDVDTDLAVLRVDGLNMSPFQIRDTPPRVGELCITLGTPLHDQYQDSVSLGVVSGTGRQIPRTETRKFEEVVQIDALINQGNSGGPLVDVESRVIGVNFLGRLLQEGVPSGINFAISSEVVRDVVPELIEHGRMRRATIGASITARTRKVDHGFEPCIQVVRTASNDSPLKAGDYITAINGSKVSRRYDLMRFLNGSVIGRDVELEVERAGKHMRLNVRAEARPDN